MQQALLGEVWFYPWRLCAFARESVEPDPDKRLPGDWGIVMPEPRQGRPRLVIDTNIFVAHFFGKRSREVVNLWREKKVVLLVSRAILNEYYEILSRFRFHKALKPLLTLLDERFNMEVVSVRSRRRVVPDDPEDDKFIHCAEAGGADAIVSGDEHLLRLKAFYEDIPIRSASDFLKEIWPCLRAETQE